MNSEAAHNFNDPDEWETPDIPIETVRQKNILVWDDKTATWQESKTQNIIIWDEETATWQKNLETE